MFNLFSQTTNSGDLQSALFSNNANTILAACVIALGIAIIYIYRSSNTKLDLKDKTIEEKDRIILELNEKRLQDMKDSRDIVVEPVREFNGVTSAMLNTLGRFHESKDK